MFIQGDPKNTELELFCFIFVEVIEKSMGSVFFFFFVTMYLLIVPIKTAVKIFQLDSMCIVLLFQVFFTNY